MSSDLQTPASTDKSGEQHSETVRVASGNLARSLFNVASSKGGRLAIAGAIALGAAGVEGLHLKGEHDAAVRLEKRINALKTVRSVIRGVAVIKGGSTFYETPFTPTELTPNGNPENGLDNKTVYTVSKDEVLATVDAGVAPGPDGQNYLAVLKPDIKPSSIHSVADRAQDTMYISYAQLENEDGGLTMYNYGPHSVETSPVTIGENGQFTVTNQALTRDPMGVSNHFNAREFNAIVNEHIGQEATLPPLDQ